MTLPTTTLNGCDDDSDMFGPPRSSPPIGYHHHRSRVPMISPKLRQREERKRILQLCAHKLERIKDSETNLRRSVCINNTYCRLTDELRREKQSRYLANLPKSDTKPETARDNIFNPYNSCGIDSSNHQPSTKAASNTNSQRISNEDQQVEKFTKTSNFGNNPQPNINDTASNNNNSATGTHSLARKSHFSCNNLDDLEKLDRELSAINAPMPLIDPEITQGAEQLEKAISSRKRLRSEDESDRLVREALSQFYIPPQRLISAIEDCPLDVISVGVNGGMGVGVGVGMSNITGKRSKLNNHNEMELDFDINQNQKEFEVIMDALRLGSPSPSSTMSSDSCGQAAMMGESASSVFHNLVVTSLET